MADKDIRRQPVFRVFISSTFSDFREERDCLQAKVFPRLEAYCRARGALFQAVDLRWGISDEASLDHRTVDICLSEIQQCKNISPRPSLLILIGDRYGWQPPPNRIPAGANKRAAREGSVADGRRRGETSSDIKRPAVSMPGALRKTEQ